MGQIETSFLDKSIMGKECLTIIVGATLLISSFLTGLYYGRTGTLPRSAELKDVNRDNVRDIVVYPMDNVFYPNSKPSIFIGETNGQYTLFDDYLKSLIKNSKEDIEKLEREVYEAGRKK